MRDVLTKLIISSAELNTRVSFGTIDRENTYFGSEKNKTKGVVITLRISSTNTSILPLNSSSNSLHSLSADGNSRRQYPPFHLVEMSRPNP